MLPSTQKEPVMLPSTQKEPVMLHAVKAPSKSPLNTSVLLLLSYHIINNKQPHNGKGVRTENCCKDQGVTRAGVVKYGVLPKE
jgi:hypothetical protein